MDSYPKSTFDSLNCPSTTVFKFENFLVLERSLSREDYNPNLNELVRLKEIELNYLNRTKVVVLLFGRYSLVKESLNLRKIGSKHNQTTL